MIDWRSDIETAVSDFLTVAGLANEPIDAADIECEFLDMPHVPPKRLPRGKMAVYCFWGDGQWLKVGKVGPNSNARYTSQHYTGSAQSTLAGSLAGDQRITGFSPAAPKAWITANTHRANLLLDANRSKTLLSLLEVFLHARLRPRYEG
jgi:hypothetical protein